ncbi:TM0106 family RecB-like putative nuclease [Nostocoides sp. F2B08]|uniref:TM0106 family RecB-like putative nuclease n=1 Tax=Nostocoides sp. F2B08 TaxID=2653936 RepID=UPI0012633115|nr:bifunctional RecB family nuclease/DEAD/DEAH box helicase [Tetrasphaera sp. F2B08]KAB7743484.1 TM0106 family RecB-like putative nuclease [Tetrasphaera sp. F2B08]
MFLLPDRLVLSPSDLRAATECEYALLRELDRRLGRLERQDPEPDPMQSRLTELGREHEQEELRRLRSAHPGQGAVVHLSLPAHDETGLTAARDRTLAALADPTVEVVAQGTVYDGSFVGHIDFLERTPGGWLISDTKLARSATVAALLQVAAYAAALDEAGVALAPVARLVLGSGVHEDFRLAEIVPVYRTRRARLDALVAARLAADTPLVWAAEDIMACGRCEVCAVALEEHDDLLLVAGVWGPTRRRLIEAGVRTRRELARRSEPVPDLREGVLERLSAQARLQLEQIDSGGPLRHEVVDPALLALLPNRSDGDIFFDFEGDPMWMERGDPSWGLEYLFGVVEVDEVASGGDPAFRAFWAHDRVQERQALVDFIGYLADRRRRWPDLHVYHYAAYEPSALLRLAARHGVCEDDVDQLLRDGVFVDLYSVVRGSIRISDRSYSLKKVEALYRGERDKDGVSEGAASIVAYHEAVAARVAGRLDEEAERLDEIRRYNEDDCRSTYQLREWLLAQTKAHGVLPEVVSEPFTPSGQRLALMRVEERLRDLVAGVRPGDRTPEQRVLALVASSVLFHAREDKPTWQRHFERLRTPIRDWRRGDETVLLVRDAEVGADWAMTRPGQRTPRRTLRLSGEPLGSAPLRPGRTYKSVYAVPAPAAMSPSPGHLYCVSSGTISVVGIVDEVVGTHRLRQHVTVEETAPGGEPHDAMPVALVEVDAMRTDSIDAALAEIGEQLLESHPALPARSAIDVLLRCPPRLRSGGPLPAVADGTDGYIDAISAALLDMDDSYVAVQGPPGTGKTYVGGRVIARLVRDHRWKVAVCSQSHKAIENILDSVIDAGLPAEQVAKHTRETSEPRWTDLDKADHLRRFVTELAEADPDAGYVVGGTVWDLTNTRRIDRGQLDLVVIDEAGQYSLAKTLAASVAGARLLLLGDPAQLPQVSTGSHPDPVDASALGWLLPEDPAEGRTLPAARGYFLERTWRLHPALAEPVSELAYDGELHAEASVTAARSLDGVEPGLHLRIVEHRDNSTSSPEEADEVVGLVESLVGRTWHDPSERDADGSHVGPRPLRPTDIVVITAYNNQVHLLRRVLDEAGWDEVPVGTVDKFQGQEAAVAILSMAASSHGNVTRGIGFLLDRNRLNVATSRGQFAAYIVRSDVLTDFAPRSTRDMVALGAFLRLCDQARRD